MEEALQQVEQLNARMAEGGGAFKLALVNPADVQTPAKNARFMTQEQFAALVANIKRDGQLSSIPFCVKKADAFHVLSGSHRIKAAVAAGLTSVIVLYTDEALSRDREVSIQLSHNAIVGQDDATLLRELWSEISSITEKLYSGLDDKHLGKLEDVPGSGLGPVRLEFRAVMLLMLPEEEERFAACCQEALDRASAADSIYLARLADFDRLMQVLAKVKKEHNVRNTAVALSIILDTFEGSK